MQLDKQRHLFKVALIFSTAAQKLELHSEDVNRFWILWVLNVKNKTEDAIRLNMQTLVIPLSKNKIMLVEKFSEIYPISTSYLYVR